MWKCGGEGDLRAQLAGREQGQGWMARCSEDSSEAMLAARSKQAGPSGVSTLTVTTIKKQTADSRASALWL